jgi:hypothetical protein
MSTNANQLDSCLDLMLQDTMFDVAAAIAATEPQSAAEPKKPAAAQSALALHWGVREAIGKAS